MTHPVNKLAEGKVIEKCPFCHGRPLFKPWEGRQLVVFEHCCSMIKFEATCFPAEADGRINQWNQEISRARRFFAAEIPK